MSRARTVSVLVFIFAAILVLAPANTLRAEEHDRPPAYSSYDLLTVNERSTRGLRYETGGAGMVVDGLVVRPISFVGTVLGTIVFVATLPFSALGGNVGEAADLLIVEPAEFTFTRCLGCWPERK